MAAQTSHQFISTFNFCIPSEQITSSHLHHFPLWLLNSYIILPPLKNYFHTLTPFSLGSLSLKFFNPSEQIILSILHHFTLFGSPALTSFTPLEKNPGSSPFNSLYPLWTNNHLALTPFFHPWQLNSYIILPPLNNYPPPLINHFIPLGSSNLSHCTHYEQITPSLLHHYTTLCSPIQLLIHCIPSDQINPSHLHHFPLLAAQLLHHFTPSEKIMFSVLHHFSLGSLSLNLF